MVVYLRFVVTGVIAIVLMLSPVGDTAPAAEPAAAPQVPALPATIPATWLTYHLAHPGPGCAFPGDPNPAYFYKGRYHLHYIYNASKGFAYAHVSSPDMVHWKWHPTVVEPGFTGHGMFSGTGFFTKDGQPAMIYHGQGSNKNWIMLGLDDSLDTWSKPMAVEVKDASGEPAKMRHWDPDCWVMNDAYYALSGGGDPPLFTSPDMKEWRLLGPLFHEQTPWDKLGVGRGEDVSCANMFKLGDKWMLLCISHALGARYYIGDFREGKYRPERHALLNWARWDFFAPESLETADGRRVAWSWCTPQHIGMQKVDRKQDFPSLLNRAVCQDGIQSLPRELSLAEDGSLKIRPLRELEALRHDEMTTGEVTVKGDGVQVLDAIAGDTLELEVVFSNPKGKPQAKEYGVTLFCDDTGKNGIEIGHGAGRQSLTVDYIEPPFELAEGEDLTMRIFIDKNMVEVFANDRQAAVAWHESTPERLRIGLFSRGGDSTARVKAWKMRSIYKPAE
ncbi:MAG: glycoside hydrolase family 32 protein [Planctomycetota bacterium]